MNPLYCTTEIRAIEHAAIAVLPEGELMRRAGLAAASAALRLLPGAASAAASAGPAPVAAPDPSLDPGPGLVVSGIPVADPAPGSVPAIAPAPGLVLVLAGPGNNGGDSLEAAAHLADAGLAVTVLHSPPAGTQSPERAAAWQRAASSGAHIIDVSSPAAQATGGRQQRQSSSAPLTATWSAGAQPLTGSQKAASSDKNTIEELAATALPSAHWQLVIDGLFGIGLARPVTGTLRALVAAVNQLNCPVLALDVPSGLDADTGAIVGPDGIALRASHTITFIGNKPGLHTNQGRDHAGLVEVAHLDIAPSLFPPAHLHLNGPDLFAGHLHARRHSGHKGTYGSVAVIGGGAGMRGAPILSARTALHAGAGRVYVLFPEDPLPADSGQPELMCRLAEGYDFEQATLAIGPGLGDSATAAELLARAIASNSALLIDADALNLLARDPALQQALAHRSNTAVLTPHPLEAARLLGTNVAGVQADRVAAARTLAARLQAVVVLKGSGTVIAAPDGESVINPTGNPALATAGTGDVLSGLCSALLAQGCPPWPAALAAVWLHGAAADELVASGIGPISMAAGELIPAIRAALNRLARRAAG
ncbi:NAD(P)H-hydrate dehydratase [Duganella sp. Leaf61]|uniref:NAD(P)H-hydrate dehydratase n=1 Tax=Duganella sp. Leaf61 TaxID=1736227 RepID=UPI0006F4DB91|nr:NAD(P)H-hydrate dehydratase [Duganella sp. Leaf61]